MLVPLQCEYYALEGLTALLDTVGRVRDTLNPALALEGLVLTMFDRRNSLARQVHDEVRTPLRRPGLPHASIPRNVRVSESPSHGMPVLTYDPGSRGCDRLPGAGAGAARRGCSRARRGAGTGAEARRRRSDD